MRRLLLRCALLLGTAAACLLPPLPGAAQAQSFPNRPVRVVIPYAAGGSLDVVGRAVGQRFQTQTGQPLVLDNRGGAGGLIGAEAVAKAAPDGYTLLMANAAQISIARALYERMPYDPEADLVPVTHLIDTPMVLFAASHFRPATVAEIVAAARAAPGTIPAGSPGNGTVGHLVLEMFSQAAGVRLLHAPYRGASQALNDMAAGVIALTFTTVASARPLLDAGTVRSIAVAAPRRIAALPDVPSFSELGMPGVDAPVWLGMMAPRGTPEPVIAALHRAFAEALAAPEVRETLGRVGAEIAAGGPEEFRAMLRADFPRWGEVVRRGNITLN